VAFRKDLERLKLFATPGPGIRRLRHEIKSETVGNAEIATESRAEQRREQS
jgi:hypothetical protein